MSSRWTAEAIAEALSRYYEHLLGEGDVGIDAFISVVDRASGEQCDLSLRARDPRRPTDDDEDDPTELPDAFHQPSTDKPS
jgi:hypothetical protein